LRTMRSCFVLAVFAALACGCASVPHEVEWLPSGPAFTPKKVEDVPVFWSRGEVKHPYGAIALLHGWNVKPTDKASLDRQVQMARELAAQNGADAIIAAINNHISEQADFTDSGRKKDPECNVYAIAIKYVDTLTAEERNILQHWKP